MSRDYSGMKFEIAEELGDCMDVVFPLYYPSKNDFEFSIYSHRHMDGVGMFTDFFKKEGLELKEQPQLQDKPPTFLGRLYALVKFLNAIRPLRFTWLHRVEKMGRSQGATVVLFSEKQTKEILDYIKVNKVSLTSYLLWSLDQTVSYQILEKGSQRKWITPINMRGPGTEIFAMKNVSASIVVNFLEDIGLHDVHLQMKNYLKKKIHWGAWLYTNMARLLGKKGTKWMAKRVKDLGIGVLSNLGQWPTKEVNIHTENYKSFFLGCIAPVSCVLPVAAASVVWNNRLMLSLQFHPSLEISKERTQEMCFQWSQKILKKAKLDQFDDDAFMIKSLTSEEIYGKLH